MRPNPVFYWYVPLTAKDFGGHALVMNADGNIFHGCVVGSKGRLVGGINHTWFVARMLIDVSLGETVGPQSELTNIGR